MAPLRPLFAIVVVVVGFVANLLTETVPIKQVQQPCYPVQGMYAKRSKDFPWPGIVVVAAENARLDRMILLLLVSFLCFNCSWNIFTNTTDERQRSTTAQWSPNTTAIVSRSGGGLKQATRPGNEDSCLYCANLNLLYNTLERLLSVGGGGGNKIVVGGKHQCILAYLRTIYPRKLLTKNFPIYIMKPLQFQRSRYTLTNCDKSNYRRKRTPPLIEGPTGTSGEWNIKYLPVAVTLNIHLFRDIAFGKLIEESSRLTHESL